MRKPNATGETDMERGTAEAIRFIEREDTVDRAISHAIDRRKLELAWGRPSHAVRYGDKDDRPSLGADRISARVFTG